jgi:hypothetical protein
VHGYRAPNFSIQDENSWSYKLLFDAGYKYDSSLYSIKHHRFNNRDKPSASHIIKFDENPFFIFPLATVDVTLLVTSIRLPLAGGAYWRILPRTLVHWGLKRINNNKRMPFHCYIHPWELDPNQPVIKNLTFLIKKRHYSGISKMYSKVSFFMKQFNFVPIREFAITTYGQIARNAFENNGN